MSPHVREGDPIGFDPRPMRQIDPGQWDLRIGWGDKTLSVRGLAIIMLIAIGVIVGTVLYAASSMVTSVERAQAAATAAHTDMARASLEQHRANMEQHSALIAAMDRAACVNSFEIKERVNVVGDRRRMMATCWWLDGRQ